MQQIISTKLRRAVKLAMPYAILDRESLAAAYGYEGEVAQNAEKAVAQLKELGGLRAKKYTAEQVQMVRNALCWGEQHLDGFIDAVAESVSAAELRALIKERKLFIEARREFFGSTIEERLMAEAPKIPMDTLGSFALVKASQAGIMVQCSSCLSQSNMYVSGDGCNWCKKGTFTALQ